MLLPWPLAEGGWNINKRSAIDKHDTKVISGSWDHHQGDAWILSSNNYPHELVPKYEFQTISLKITCLSKQNREPWGLVLGGQGDPDKFVEFQ